MLTSPPWRRRWARTEICATSLKWLGKFRWRDPNWAIKNAPRAATKDCVAPIQGVALPTKELPMRGSRQFDSGAELNLLPLHLFADVLLTLFRLPDEEQRARRSQTLPMSWTPEMPTQIET